MPYELLPLLSEHLDRMTFPEDHEILPSYIRWLFSDHLIQWIGYTLIDEKKEVVALGGIIKNPSLPDDGFTFMAIGKPILHKVEFHLLVKRTIRKICKDLNIKTLFSDMPIIREDKVEKWFESLGFKSYGAFTQKYEMMKMIVQ